MRDQSEIGRSAETDVADAKQTISDLFGRIIEIKEKKKSSQRFKDVIEVTGSRLVPEWLESDKENLKGRVIELPKREAIDVPVDEMQIVELYSK